MDLRVQEDGATPALRANVLNVLQVLKYRGDDLPRCHEVLLSTSLHNGT